MSSGGFSIGITGGVDGSGVDGDDVKPRWGGITILGNVEGHAEFSSTFQVSSESAQAAVATFERSTSKGLELTGSRSVTREVFGASLQAFVNLDNSSGAAFALSNLEITVSAPDPRDRRSLLPVATLLPNTTLITGEPATYHLGAFQAARGPILFASEPAFPNLVESLLRDPSGLVLQIANYEIEDEFERNFAFTSQVARDRTVGVVIDSGDGKVERHFVAVAPVEDINGNIVGGFGNFPGVGPRPSVSLGYVFEEVLFLERSTVVVPEVWTGLPATDSRAPDAIRAGLNGTSESTAQGDDLQLIPAASTA
jgi:hypothetical protein